MLFISPLSTDVAALREGLAGAVVLPGDAGWDAARQAWNLAADQRPALVALPESAADVQTLVDFARGRGLRVAMQGTGHNAVPMGPLDDTLLIKTERMRRVEIDERNCIARVEAGALWIDVTAPASEAGLAPLAGSSSDVGVVGYTLGGGLSWLGRKYGLAANRLLSADVVTADGRLVRASRHENPDLFWALRGGGGNFGAVVAIEFELIPMRSVYAGMMLFPWERAREVLQAWREWTAGAPESVTTSARIMQFPPMEELPPFLRGRGVVLIDGAIVEETERAAELLAPLRALGPEMDTFEDIPPVGLSRIHMDPEQPMPGISDSMMLDRLDAETVDRLVDATGPGSGSPLLMVELRHLGGALGRYAGGALSRFEGEYLYFAAGIPMDPAVVAALEAHFAIVGSALAPASSGRQYLNFAERPHDPVAFYGEETYARLREVKAEVDPLEVFRGNHEIPAA
ncbi:MAG TPA: FAD-binding oxidoreductase [Solirubrobacteraceae bacterium]|nr:FAD-binding oxidoreductase [Solirubrobacteraceae bacterium]